VDSHSISLKLVRHGIIHNNMNNPSGKAVMEGGREIIVRLSFIYSIIVIKYYRYNILNNI